MLQFVVLGLVPGTHVQITFTWVLLTLLTLTVLTLVIVKRPRLKQLFIKSISTDTEQTA